MRAARSVTASGLLVLSFATLVACGAANESSSAPPDAVYTVRGELVSAPDVARRELRIRHEAVAVRRPLEAGSSGKPNGSTLIVEDNQALGTCARHGTQAKAEPGSALRDHQVVFAF